MSEPSKFLIFAATALTAGGEHVALMTRNPDMAKSLGLAKASHSGASSQFNIKAGVVSLSLGQVQENIEKLAIHTAMKPGDQTLIDARENFLKAEKAIQAAIERKKEPAVVFTLQSSLAS